MSNGLYDRARHLLDTHHDLVRISIRKALWELVENACTVRRLSLGLRAFSKKMWESAQRLLFHIAGSFHSASVAPSRGGIMKYWATTGRAYSVA